MLLHKLTNRKFWYSLKVEYITKSKRVVTQSTYQVGLLNKSDVIDLRLLKLMVGPSFIKTIPKSCLSNGSIRITVICYLGWIKSTIKNHKIKKSFWNDLFDIYLNTLVIKK